jgi:hypothetical protein
MLPPRLLIRDAAFPRGPAGPRLATLLLPAAALGALLLGALLLGACEYHSSARDGQALRREQQRATTPDQVSRGVEFAIYENDHPRAVVEAERMERYEREDSTYTILRPAADSAKAGSTATAAPEAGRAAANDSSGRVTTRIYDSGSEKTAGRDDAKRPTGRERGSSNASSNDSFSNDSVSATIRADRIVYRDAAGRFDARGQVVVTTASGKRLEGEHLTWHEEEGRITTPGFVEITTPTDRIQGYGLRADENLDSYQLGRVTGQVTVEDPP